MNIEFRGSLRFNEAVDVALAVDDVGNSSICYAVVVTRPDGVAAEAQITACLVDRESRQPVPWPADLRRLLTEAREQTV